MCDCISMCFIYGHVLYSIVGLSFILVHVCLLHSGFPHQRELINDKI